LWLALPFASLSAVSFLAADVVVLTTDGRLQGTLLNAQESPRKNYIVQTDSGQVTLDKEQVKEIISQTADELEYERLRFSFPDTVDGQWKIAEWCRERGMSKERTTHLERIVEIDSNHKQARGALGYGQVNGRWVRQEDVMKERGYVKYKGKWLLPQDVEIQEQKRKSEIAQKEWFKRLRLVRAQLDDRGPRAAAALKELQEVSDPDAIPAIIELFKNERSESVQRLYIAALARMNTASAVRVLGEIALESSNEETRLTSLDHLKKIKSPASVSQFVGALKSKDNATINRAGTALGELGDVSAIGPLIGVLMTVHKSKVQQGGANTLSPSFDSNGGIGFGAGAKTVIVRNKVVNRGVHEALVKLADGVDFGFDTRAWANWHASQKKPAPKPGRRD
jgi:hypothetical protein